MLFSPSQSPVLMHIPDGFLSVLVSIMSWVISILVLGISLRKSNQIMGSRMVPLMGVLAAAIFAGQMLNFTVAGGTSGHLLGAAISTILLGPWPAMLVMTSVVAVQALIFQDGGILVMGANLFNMAIVGVLVSHAIYTAVNRVLSKLPQAKFISGFLAAWSSIFVASLAAALQLALSGTSPANLAIPAMAGIHAIIGVGEGLITVGAMAFLSAVRKDLLAPNTQMKEGSKGLVIGGLAISFLLAAISPLASSHPDGLEWVAEQQGFLQSAREAVYLVIPDYTLPGISNPALATILAGIIGVIIVFSVVFFLSKANRGREEQ